MSHIGVSSPSGLVSPSKSARRLGALSGLSDRELLARVKDLVSQERAVTLEVLLHLNEVERRRLHLGLGYPSLFEYCIRHLGYSSSAAGRRIPVARCIRNYPEVHGLLEKNEVNLSTVSLVATILTRGNKDDLLERIRNKSQKEVEAMVADYRPPVSLRDRARPVCVAVPEPSNGTCELPMRSASVNSRCGSEKTPNVVAAGSVGDPPQATTATPALRQASTQPSSEHPTSPAPHIERKFHVQFLAGERFMKKFERAKALLSNKNSGHSYEAVLEAALDEFLKDHDPENRGERRETRQQRAASKTRPGSSGKKRAAQPRSGRSDGQRERAAEHSRHIAASIRDAVFRRDKGRCSYVGSTRKRCGSTHNLQFDHIVPYARGGTNSVDNLRLLCERHNKLEAERVYGPTVMKRFRARE
jgi:5-methylcytosine-specific restriction endonuclease McrA